MSDSKIRKVGTITLDAIDYDLAVNGEGKLATERTDIYGRPYAHEVTIFELIGKDSGIHTQNLCQELLTLLARTMIERDAALLALQKGETTR